ncbi:MAG: hypothetical protein OXI77_05270 [Chloroflexota bacterium]|nr:hypothetical protein [Chloroflexota bacterium]MDE2910079.1 hypothetical protein [Chloroflexota bacterium]
MSAAIRSPQNRSFYRGDNLPFPRVLPAAGDGWAGWRAPSNRSTLMP